MNTMKNSSNKPPLILATLAEIEKNILIIKSNMDELLEKGTVSIDSINTFREQLRILINLETQKNVLLSMFKEATVAQPDESS